MGNDSERFKFCDLRGGEIEMLRRSLREGTDVPLLVLESDCLSAGSMGQIRPRVQALLEGLA